MPFVPCVASNASLPPFFRRNRKRFTCTCHSTWLDPYGYRQRKHACTEVWQLLSSTACINEVLLMIPHDFGWVKGATATLIENFRALFTDINAESSPINLRIAQRRRTLLLASIRQRGDFAHAPGMSSLVNRHGAICVRCFHIVSAILLYLCKSN